MLKRLAAMFAALLLATPAIAMTAASIPTKFSIPWGNSAGGGYIRAIPTPSQIGVQNGAASLTDGFPPLTFVPVGSGGVPPFGQDFNGILKQITAWSRWQGAGGLPVYDGTFSGAIGGYPQGAVLAGASPGVVWLNLVDNNTSNPDSAGANWKQLALTDGSTLTNTTLTQPLLTLQQGASPTPTAEGRIEWATTQGQIVIGHNSGTVSVPTAPAPGSIYGLTTSNDAGDAAHSIDFAAGTATDSANLLYITLGSSLVKQLNNAWTAGSNAGGLFSGSMTNTTYYEFLIENPTTGVSDAGFSTSLTASDHPSGFTNYRRVGAVIVAGGSIRPFVQDGNSFYWNTSSPPQDYSASGTRAKAALGLTVPSGIRVQAIMQAAYQASGSQTFDQFFYDGVNTSVAAEFAGTPGGIGYTSGRVLQFTNTSAQIQYAVPTSSGGGGSHDDVITLGWVDPRGQY